MGLKKVHIFIKTLKYKADGTVHEFFQPTLCLNDYSFAIGSRACHSVTSNGHFIL